MTEAVNPSLTAAATKLNGRGLHLLSIEGRGICALSALITLKEVLREYQYLQKLPQLPRACDVFDLAGGSGTGGFIVVMLFRLGMTVDAAISAFIRLSTEVFSKQSALSQKKSSSIRLEKAVAKAIQVSLGVDHSRAEEILMLDDNGPKCFVIASTAKNLLSPTLFRTYIPRRHASYNCTIVDAIRATTAEEPFFSSIDIGSVDIKETFIYGGSRLNNPVKAALEEIMLVFPGQRVSCVVSIGSGAQGAARFESTSTTGVAKLLTKVMNDGEFISEEVAKELADKEVLYCRLNVDHGLQDIGFGDWERLGDVKTHTRKYLEKYDVTQKVHQLVQILNRRKAKSSTVEGTLRSLSKFLDGLVQIQPEESWNTVISEFIRIIEPSQAATDMLNIQCALLRDTLESCMQGGSFAVLPDELRGNVQQLLGRLRKTFQNVIINRDGEEDPAAYIYMNIQQLLQRFWLRNHIAGNIMVHDILKYLRKDDLSKHTHAINQNLANLNLSPSAAYDSFEASKRVSCFKGTRVRLLNEIATWIASDDPSLPPIYVLDGVAGIGKSTIAQTVAEHAAGINALGASFFFSRNDDKRKTARTFFPTLAYQLAYYNTDFADQINATLLRTPHTVTQLPHKQFSSLIVEPLKKFFASIGDPIIIVVDALDECEQDGDAILKTFADFVKNMSRLKLFITTRPEHHIRTVLDRYHHLQRFHLQDIEKSVVQSDIRLYLDFYLSENRVQDKLPDLDYTWKPVEKDMEVLIGICGTLFILASTAVKFILDNKRCDPAKQLSRLLRGVSRQDFSGSKYTTAMDSLYTHILLSAVPDDDDDGTDDNDDWFERFQIVMGTIVALQYPLPCLALSAIVNLVPDDVKRTLSHLHSLVAPTGQDLTFRIHHKSFPDFVTSSSRCERRFLIDLMTRHLELGKRCLSIMDSHLKPNVCNLGSTDRFKDNRDIRHLTQDHISLELAYASTHWSTHLANASKLDSEAEELVGRFASKHFLSWLEVLSFIGQLEIAHSSLDKVGKLLNESKSKASITSREIFHDGSRYVAMNLEIIKVAAGHIFSTFAFVPQNSTLFRTYGGSEGIKLKVIFGYETKWNPMISVMAGHTGSVNLVTYSGDSTKLASASDDKTVRLWDGITGAEITVLRGHSNSVHAVAFSPDGTKLASASGDRTVRLWDCQTGAEIAILRWHSNSVNSVVFSPDGTKLASISDDETIRLWDGQTGDGIVFLRGHSDWLKSVCFSSDGTKLASASRDRTVRLWESQTVAELDVLRGHSDCVTVVVFSPDGTKLASASLDKTIRLWHSQTGAEITVLWHSNSVNSITFSPDATKLASACDDETVRLWDGQTGTGIAILRGHVDLVSSVAFSPYSTKLASASRDRTVRLWDSQTGTEIAVLRGHLDRVNNVAFSSDGSKLVSASHDRTMRLWDGQTGTETTISRGIWKWVKSMAFSQDTSTTDGESVQASDGQTGSGIAVPTLVEKVLFSPDGTRLASVSTDGTMRLRDGRTGVEIAVLRGHSKLAKSVVFSPDGTKLASASDDESVRLWDGQTGTGIAILSGHDQFVNSVVFSPDSTTVASASHDRTVRLWDSQTGARQAIFRGHPDWVKLVVFSPYGTRLASASRDGTIRLWSVPKGPGLVLLRGHSESEGVHLVVFSPSGRRLASASLDGTLRLWSTRTGAKQAVLRGHTMLNFMVFSPDDRKIAAASDNGRVQLWEVETGTEIARFLGSQFVAFTLDSSGLLSMNARGFCQINCITGDKVSLPGKFLYTEVEGIQLPGSNLWVILMDRTQPSLPGLLVMSVDDKGLLSFASLCWFPPNLPVTSFAVSSLSRVALGCQDGHILLLDIDFPSLL